MRPIVTLISFVAACAGFPGCSFLLAPVTVPQAIASNANFSLQGTVVDINGNPLDGVLMAQTWHHLFWAPSGGTHTTDEHRILQINGHYSVEERGTEIELQFSRPGYFAVLCKMASYEPNAVAESMMVDGRDVADSAWHADKPFPIVMIAHDKPAADLLIFGDNFFIMEPARANGSRLIFLEPGYVDDSRGPTRYVEYVAGKPETLPPLTMYLDVAPSMPRPINSRVALDPADVDLPERITLHVKDADVGFQRIETRNGQPPLLVNVIAPTEGYRPELVIERAHLKAMRVEPSATADAHEFFFIRLNGHYGKGFITCSNQMKRGDQQAPTPPSFLCRIWLQRQPDNRDLTLWREY